MKHATLLLALAAMLVLACGGGSSDSSTTPIDETRNGDETPAGDETPTGDTSPDTDPMDDGKAQGVCVTGIYVELGERTDTVINVGLSYPRYSDENYETGTFGEVFRVSTENADDVIAAIENKLIDAVMLRKGAGAAWVFVDAEECPPVPG